MSDRESASPSPLQIVNYGVWSSSDSEADEDGALVANAAAPPEEDAPRPQQEPGEDVQPRSLDFSSSDHDDEQSESDSDRSTDETVPSLTPGQLPRKYALGEKEMPLAIVQLLKDVKEHFTKPLYLKRQARPISKTTFDKAYERICCYLGYLKNVRRLECAQFKPKVFVDEELIQKYLNYLDETRRLNPSTTANHVSAILYVAKFIHREKAPRYDVPIVAQLRRVQTELQTEGERLRPKTSEELTAAGAWLSWEQILECLQLQYQRFELTRDPFHRAKEMMDLVLIAVYTNLPPARAAEMRTLRFYLEEQNEVPFAIKNFPNENILVKSKLDGTFCFHFQCYKTSKYRGHDQVPVEAGSDLGRLLSDYLENHRQRLLHSNPKVENFFFVNSKGGPFTSPSYTKHLQGLFERLTGVKISVNCLRSSFITHAYSQEGCTDTLKSSIAEALRHSVKQGQAVYDKRTALQKKQPALLFAKNCLPDSDDITAPQPSEGVVTRARGSEFTPGQFVAVVEETSTLKEPKFHVGRIIHSSETTEDVPLLWYKCVKGSLYKAEFQASPWTESCDSLVPVRMTPSKKLPEVYSLSTAARTIHKKVFS